MTSKMRVLALTLWLITLGCFAVGWLASNRVATGVGCATLVFYLIVGARARGRST